MTKIVSLANQKGGVGKSTLTSVIANYLHFEHPNIKTLVVDTDTQKTLLNLREGDLENNDIDPNKLYKLIWMDSRTLFENLHMFDSYDIVLIDLPGTIMQEGVIQAYSLVDYLFIPTALTRQDWSSTMKFVSIMKEKITPIREKHGLITGQTKGVLNKINFSTREYKEFLKIKDTLELEFIKTAIPNSSVAFQREATTFMPYDEGKTLEFCKEVFEIIMKEE